MTTIRRLPLLAAITAVIVTAGALPVGAVGSTGWYATRFKVEYQYTDYNSYSYPDPIPPTYPDLEYRQVDPYIADFPEGRTLVKLTQSFGPGTTLQVRYQYSDMTADKLQRLYYSRLAREITDMTCLYGVWQYLEQPGWLDGYMAMAGIRHDRAGWILAEAALGYLDNVSFSGIDGDPGGGKVVSGVRTFAPLLSLRYSLNSSTALFLKWEGFFAEGDIGSVTSHVVTTCASRFFPTQTALHLSARFYDNDIGMCSLAPGVEVAQYILWNLTLRMSYRYYNNHFDDPKTAEAISGDSICSHSLRTFVEWQVGAVLTLHMKYRRYVSNQHIRMNT